MSLKEVRASYPGGALFRVIFENIYQKYQKIGKVPKNGLINKMGRFAPHFCRPFFGDFSDFLLFLVNIFEARLTKSSTKCNQKDRQRLWRAQRAILLLMRPFVLHFVLILVSFGS